MISTWLTSPWLKIFTARIVKIFFVSWGKWNWWHKLLTNFLWVSEILKEAGNSHHLQEVDMVLPVHTWWGCYCLLSKEKCLLIVSKQPWRVVVVQELSGKRNSDSRCLRSSDHWRANKVSMWESHSQLILGVTTAWNSSWSNPVGVSRDYHRWLPQMTWLMLILQMSGISLKIMCVLSDL